MGERLKVGIRIRPYHSDHVADHKPQLNILNKCLGVIPITVSVIRVNRAKNTMGPVLLQRTRGLTCITVSFLSGFKPGDMCSDRIVVGLIKQDVYFKDPTTQSVDSRTFDYAFDSQDETQDKYASQQVVYDAVGPGCLDNFVQGFHCSLFTYGQTGSGKTHTITGSQEDPGLVPRLITELFERLEKKKQNDPDYNGYMRTASSRQARHESLLCT
eukprot:9486603-Pyramimonas_sp.AAC.2